MLPEIAIGHVVSRNFKQNTALAIMKWSVMEKKWCHITDDHTFQEDLEIITYLFSLGNTNTYDIFGVSLAISATQHYFWFTLIQNSFAGNNKQLNGDTSMVETFTS